MCVRENADGVGTAVGDGGDRYCSGSGDGVDDRDDRSAGSNSHSRGRRRSSEGRATSKRK